MHTDKITLWNQKYSDQLKFLGFLIHDILVFAWPSEVRDDDSY